MGEHPEVRPLTIAQFAAEHGLVTSADVESHIHAGLRSKPQTKTYDRWFARELARLQNERDATTAAYRRAVEAGDIRPHSAAEQLNAAASGHEDNISTQAAQRVLAKRQERAITKATGDQP